MKTFVATLLIGALAQAAPAIAAPSTASPLLGSWSVDVSRLPVPPDARPKRVTITFGQAADGNWSTRVDIVGGDGVETEATGSAALDGKATPVAGSIEADVAALKLPQPNVLVMALGKNGQLASTRVYAVAADGKTMVETATYNGTDGLPYMRTNYFTRVK